MKKIFGKYLTAILASIVFAAGQILPYPVLAEQKTEETEEVFDIKDVPAYSGDPYVVVHDNEPYFSDSELTESAFEAYEDLDELGRAQCAIASVGMELMPETERESISKVTPTGWVNHSYDFVDGGYVYNRCHLIGYQLTAENANEKNLITGTRYLNIEGMLPFENMIADYVKELDNHVYYRVTPIYKGKNLVASGVLMEAKSVEDDGEGILFCVYCYNVQPGVSINYKTGDNSADGTVLESSDSKTKASKVESVTVESTTTTYVLNTNTKKFHYPNCRYVKTIADHNRSDVSTTRQDLIAQGFDPCKGCNP